MNEMEELNSLYKSCKHLHRSCEGMEASPWTGCVLRDRSEEEAIDYIKSMDELNQLEAVIDAQAREANTPPEELTEEQIINNRFL